MAMRTRSGAPDGSMSPQVLLEHSGKPSFTIVTILCRNEEYSLNSEMFHIARQTNDPAERRSRALDFLSAGYYQQHNRFSDILAASFLRGSGRYLALTASGTCRLEFCNHSTRYRLECTVLDLDPADHHHSACRLHNQLFNPDMPPDLKILGFKPDWNVSSIT